MAEPILGEIAARLEFLDRVGLEYLTLDRPAGTLSGGELQRVRLASGLGSGLVGVCYVLDEPSIGLHPRDTERLIAALGDLQGPRQHSGGGRARRDDHAAGRLAGGPWAGGGATRRPRRCPGHARRRWPPAIRSPAAIWPAASRFRCQRSAAASPPRVAGDRRRDHQQPQELNARLPLSALVCITGVSGSGKSSLIDETLARALVRRLGGVGAQARPIHQPPRGKPHRQGGADRPVAHRADAAQQSGHFHRRV